VEKLFYVKPGADPSKIVVEVDGAKGLRLSKNGEIIIQTGLGELKLSKPIAWQEKDGKKLPVEVSYKLLGKNRYSFVVAKADPSLPIVIDPILQATYLGGNSRDEAYALVIHPQTGEIYVAGYTLSSNFPKTAGGAQTGCISCINDLPDIFVARLNLDLTQILQVTYLGGRSRDEAYALAIHPTTGEVYVVGATNSTDFPKTTGGVQANKHRNYDAFVARLNSNLNQILQSTYLGGSERDEAHAIAIHPATGEVYVAGYTYSNDFPKTDGGARTYNDGDFDVFVARLNKELTRIFQSTYLGGRDFDFAKALVIHPRTGDVYVAGETKSTSLPNTTNGAQAAYGGGDYDAFVARLNSDLTKILQSTYLGGKGRDSAYALAIHPETGDVYVAGETKSTDFPNTTGGAQAGYGGGYKDAFVVRLNSNLNQILQSTYLGGNDWDEAYALAIHPKTGDVYVAGYTKSTDFPNTTGGAQAGYGGGYKDAFVARLNSNLTQILQSTYLGGLGWDEVNALAIHPKTGEVYAAGRTSSSCFPKTTGGAQVNNGGDWDAFVARLTADLAASRSSGGGGVSLMTASASSTTSFWSILLLLSVPTFALARRIRRR